MKRTSSLLGFRYVFGGISSSSSLPYNLGRSHSNYSPKSTHKNLKEALTYFHEMLRLRPLSSVITFNQLWHQITKMKYYSVVVYSYKQMGQLGIRPDLYSLSILINCFCHLNHVDFGFSVFGKIIKLGHKPENVTMNTLLKGFFAEGKVAEAQEFYRKMTQSGCKPNLITYSRLLNGLCKIGNTSAAIRYMRMMEKTSNCKPNTVCYSTVIDGLCKDGIFAKAHSLFMEMNRKGISLNVVTYNTLIHGACVLDEWKEVWEN